MTQEAITEMDMDVYSRRIGPYFTWLESKIESGWEQNETVQKDVLKEVKYLATTMRARFILGVSKTDFSKEVQRTLELFELATEAFPPESDEIEAKIKHFVKGISEELGAEFIPSSHRLQPEPIPEPEPIPIPEPEPIPEPDKPMEPELKPEPIKKKAKKPKKIEKPKIAETVEKPKIEKVKTEKPKEKVKKQRKTNKPKKNGKSFVLVRWVKGFIWGED
ncbi:hypothetical protein KY309_00180 [Candidatus Woesearchaeota archaeon]|nr:hypothetical protein [Candidatus Woesearchaeota archaeon]MBW3016009.1 hypothetical protein [Candidatus Woesearchaeota archaeon]